MAISRYWRLVGFATLGNVALELSEARIYEGGVLADASATLTATIAPASGVVADLRDGVATGVVSWPYASYSASGFALVWDFGSGAGVELTCLQLGAGSSVDTYSTEFTAQYSTDGQNWTTYDVTLNAAWPGALTLTTAIAESDPYAASVVLYLPFNGTNGSTTFTDISPSPKTITAGGNAQISTAQSVYGGSSAYFDGAGDYLYAPTGNDFRFGTGDFTVEMFLYLLSTNPQNIFDGCPIGGNGARPNAFSLYIDVGGAARIFANGNSSPATSNVVALLTWTHVAMVRKSGVVTIYIGGINGVSFSYTSNITDGGCVIGAYANASMGNWVNGYINQLRITKGVARYTENFVPKLDYVSIHQSSSLQKRTSQSAPTPERMLPAIALPDTTVKIHSREAPFFDAYSGPPVVPAGGVVTNTMTGNITGTVKNTPATPVSRRVLLMDQRSQLVVRETWSDPITGAYAFNGLNTATEYAIISYDHTRTYRAVIADYITPDPLP